MKIWKQELVNAIVASASELKIVSLRKVANARGINHIRSGDVRDIALAVEKQLPDYYPIRLIEHEHDSEFCSLCFASSDVQFMDDDEFQGICNGVEGAV